MSEEEDSDGEESNDELRRIANADTDHITMSVTASVSDMDEDEVERLRTLARQMEDAFEEIVAKNRDYGWSFMKTGEKLASSDNFPVEDVTECQIMGLLHRAGDKRARLIENVFGSGDGFVSDSPDVTAVEAANYWHFIAMILTDE